MFLLAVTALSLGATVRGTLSLADDAGLVTRAQALATTRVEDVMSSPCGATASGTDNVARMTLLWQKGGSQRNTTLQLDLELERSPIQFAGTPIEFAIVSGGICP